MLSLLCYFGNKWQEEIEQAISRVKKSRTRSEADKWFRKQWYSPMMRDRKKKKQTINGLGNNGIVQ